MFKILSLALIFLAFGLWTYLLWLANKELHSDSAQKQSAKIITPKANPACGESLSRIGSIQI
jgi:hypothetical protein